MAADQPTVNRYRKSRRKIVIPDRVAERAATKWDDDGDGCWISTYSVLQSGYAQIGWNERGKHYGTTAHRAAWVYFHGEQIPEGMVVDHMCKNKRCVNPGHLRLLTNFENARRTSGRDWTLGECANGHPNSELYWDGSKYKCKPCHLDYQRRYREKYPERVAESNRRYAEKNREKIAESRRRYKEKYPERVAETNRRYREKKRQERSA